MLRGGGGEDIVSNSSFTTALIRSYAHVDVASASGLKSASMAWQLMIANNSLLRRMSYVE